MNLHVPEIRVLYTVCALVLASTALAGCDELSAEELQDPALLLGDEELWDEGPPPGDEAIEPDDDDDLFDQDPDDLELAAGPGGELGGFEELTANGYVAAPYFQLPFPCGQVWAGQTRTNHSPLRAVDFNRANDFGDKVVAAANGTVTRVENTGNTSYGRWIEIKHGNSGYRTRYAHLSSQSVVVGQSVNKGQKIGKVGNSGGSSGAHLHYELILNGTAVKPTFAGKTALFYGTKNYTSYNKCSSNNGSSGTVNTSGPSLNVRSSPSTGASIVGSVSNGQQVSITCQKKGSTVTGTYGTTNLWDFIGTGYVSDAYIYTGSDSQVAPTCN